MFGRCLQKIGGKANTSLPKQVCSVMGTTPSVIKVLKGAGLIPVKEITLCVMCKSKWAANCSAKTNKEKTTFKNIVFIFYTTTFSFIFICTFTILSMRPPNALYGILRLCFSFLNYRGWKSIARKGLKTQF